MTPFVVCIDGLIGAGKSSLLKRLEVDYSTFPEQVHEWNLLQSMYKNVKVYGLAFQIQVLISQFNQHQNFPNDIVLVERCPWTSRNIFAPLLLNDDDFKIYDINYLRFKYPVDKFIYLDVSPEEAFQRIQNRSTIDNSISLEYLQDLYDRYAENFISESRFTDVYKVDAYKSQNEVEQQVRNILLKLKKEHVS